MYKHILLPIDGSALSRQAIASAMLFAKNCGASVTALHVIPLPHEDLLEAWLHHDPGFAQRQQAMFDRLADEYLSFAANSALAEGIPCHCRKVQANEPWRAIVETAERQPCDLIYMASHGWQGGGERLPGSETLKVLEYCTVPVLVYKPAGARSHTSNQ